MSGNNNNTSTTGIGFAGMLTILFIGLKLSNIITWSWIWVLSPLWIGLAFVIALVAIVFLGALGIMAVAAVIEQVERRMRK